MRKHNFLHSFYRHFSTDLVEIVLARPVGLINLMLNSCHLINIQEREHKLYDFIMNTFLLLLLLLLLHSPAISLGSPFRPRCFVYVTVF